MEAKKIKKQLLWLREMMGFNLKAIFEYKAAFLMRGSRSRLRLMPSLAERGEHAMIVKDAHVPSPG